MCADRLPDFVGVGALKAGTSFLDALLREHPQLSLPVHLKEVNFFNRHYERGPDWYAAQFAAPDGRRRGEISPQYLFDAECPPRIRDANPEVRVLLTVRDPVARTFSQYRHWVQQTGYRADFDTFLDEHPGAAERSRYWQLLQRFRAVLPDDQVHVVVFEDLVGDPLVVLPGVFAFLGVDRDVVPSAVHRPANVSGSPRFPRGYAAAQAINRRLLAHGAYGMVARVKRTGVGRLLQGRGAPAPAPEPAEATAARLAADFAPDVDALGAHLGRDLRTLWGV